jgi:L-seryl-tRNA(Ser) seleniumtransferase
MALSALEFTVQKHLESKNDPESSQLPDLPAYFLLNQSKDDLRKRATDLFNKANCKNAQLEIIETDSEIGGGTMPRTRMESIAISMLVPKVKPDAIAKYFRECSPPVMGYVHQGSFHLNLRTIFPDQDKLISECIQQVEEKLIHHSPKGS